jgi:hypothetical protein
VAVVAVLACSVMARPAVAQAPNPPHPRAELSVTALWEGPALVGARAAEFTRPSGEPLTIFTTRTRLVPGVGVGASFGLRVGSNLSIEGAGRWRRAEWRTRIAEDVDGAAVVTLTTRIDRLGADGAVLWTARRSGPAEFFLRTGAGWTRQFISDGAYVVDGSVAHIGAGVKYWTRTRPGGAGRVGVRVEGFLAVRLRGLTVGEDAARLAPGLAGGLIIGL